MNNQKIAILDICQTDNKFSYLSNIEDARSQAELDIQILNETIASVDALKPHCDKLDYALSACSGALCWRDRSMLGQHGSHKTVPRYAF